MSNQDDFAQAFTEMLGRKGNQDQDAEPEPSDKTENAESTEAEVLRTVLFSDTPGHRAAENHRIVSLIHSEDAERQARERLERAEKDGGP